MPREPRVQLSVTLTPELAQRAEELARRQHVSVAELLRRLLGSEVGRDAADGDSGATVGRR
jgi:Ribbon-helix-helix protein, copG family